MNDRVADAVQTIAEQYSSITWVDVPAPVRDRVLMALFDTLSVMIAAAESNEVKAFAVRHTEVGYAPLVRFSKRTSVEASRWTNGASVCAYTHALAEEFNARLPERRGVRVTVVLRNGTPRSAEVDHPVGYTAHQPMGWDEIRRKNASLIGSVRSLALESAVRELEFGSVDDLTDTLVAV